MEKLHAIDGGNSVDEIMVGSIKYIRSDKVEKQRNESNISIDYEKLGKAIGIGIAKALSSSTGLIGNTVSKSVKSIRPNPTPKGLSNLPDEKKGNELSAILYGKLPSGLRHPARFRSFYTDFERDTGISLYEFHKNRMDGLDDGVDKSRYPNRKADSIFIVTDESTVFEYARNYEFKF